jgi:hypothetical protein
MKKMTVIAAGIFAAVMLTSTGCSTTDAYLKSEPGADNSAVTAKDIVNAENTEKESTAIADTTPQKGEETKKLGSDVVATAGDYVLTKEKYRIITEYMKQRFDYKLDPGQEKEFIRFIMNKKLMAMEARKLGYAERTDLKTKYEWDFDDILSHVYYEENVEKKSDVTDKEAKEYFDSHTGDFAQIRAQQFFTKSKSMADSLLKRINSGEDFTEIIRKYSEDATTKDKGGDMGFFSKGDNFKEIDDVAFSLADGEVSPVIKTVNGYHIIKVNERKKFGYEESKDKIKSIIKDKKLQNIFDTGMENLRKKYKVVINQDAVK